MSFTYKMYIFDLMSHKEQEQEQAQEQQQHIRSMDPRCSRSKKVPVSLQTAQRLRLPPQ